MILSLDLMILGIVTIIYVIFYTGVGIKIAFAYFKVKNRTFIYAGIAVIGTAFTWMSATIFFLSLVFFNEPPPLFIYFLLHGAFIPISSYIWILAILGLFEVPPRKQKWIKIIFGTFWLSLEIIYLNLLFINPLLLGKLMENQIKVDYTPFSEIFLLISLTQMVTTNFMLGIKYWRSIDKKIQIRGKIITIAIGIFLFAALLEIFVPITLVIVLARILIMLYAIVYYIGFIFPSWAENIFLKHRDSEGLEESKDLKDEAQEFLKILSQRRDVTAKEVTFYREKKICLVCKGKVGGFNNYICTKCDALYCEKCARALTQLENSCWACSEAIDKSKPIRKIESEEEVKELIKSVESQKKPKK